MQTLIHWTGLFLRLPVDLLGLSALRVPRDALTVILECVTPEIIAAVVLGAFGFMGVIIQRLRGSPWHDDLRRDLEILKLLPEQSRARGQLLEHIDNKVIKNTAGPAHRRDALGVGLAAVLLASSVTLAVTGLNLGGWWNLLWLGSGLLALFGAVGLADSLRKISRDAKAG